jgi:hypothetical protein
MSQDAPSQSSTRNGPGNAALVLGVVAVVFAVVPVVGDYVAIPAAVLAIVLGLVGLLRVEKGMATNRGAALAGAVLGFVAGFVTFLIIAASVVGPAK